MLQVEEIKTYTPRTHGIKIQYWELLLFQKMTGPNPMKQEVIKQTLCKHIQAHKHSSKYHSVQALLQISQTCHVTSWKLLIET